MSQVGIECYHGFGDGLFNVPLLKTISEHHHSKVVIATKRQCSDAFHNLPWVDKIVPIGGIGDGAKLFKNYKHKYQITPQTWFHRFRQRDKNHSLIDTPSLVAAELGLPAFDQRPIFIPTNDERRKLFEPKVVIESTYFSGQSWADGEAFGLIAEHYPNATWLSLHSNKSPPYSRRQLIMHLQYADTMFSVGSGFFCAALALPAELQPKRIVCLWTDNVYKYEAKLATLGWHESIVWVHNLQELRDAI